MISHTYVEIMEIKPDNSMFGNGKQHHLDDKYGSWEI